MASPAANDQVTEVVYPEWPTLAPNPLRPAPYRIWRTTPARPCGLIGCEAPTVYTLVFTCPPAHMGESERVKQLPICPECALTGFGIRLRAEDTVLGPIPTRGPRR